jgi:hypothetical protein
MNPPAEDKEKCIVEPPINVPLFKFFPHLIQFQWFEICVDVIFLTFKIFLSLFISATEENIMALLEKQTAISRAVIDDTKYGHGWPFFIFLLLATLQIVCSNVNIATGKRKERLQIFQNKLLFLPPV